MRWGSAVNLWQKLYDEGREPPEAFFEQPEAEPHLKLHWDAFQELSTERQIGMGVGPIPMSVVKRYFVDEWGFQGRALDHACAMIRVLDNEFVTRANASKSDKDDLPFRERASARDPKGVKQLMRGMSKPGRASKRK